MSIAIFYIAITILQTKPGNPCKTRLPGLVYIAIIAPLLSPIVEN